MKMMMPCTHYITIAKGVFKGGGGGSGGSNPPETFRFFFEK